MNHVRFKTTISIITIACLLIAAIKTNDALRSDILASIAILLGAFSSNHISNEIKKRHEQN